MAGCAASDGQTAMMQATIEAEPHPLAIDLGRAALLVIDMQRDFLEPGGFGEAWATTCRGLPPRSGPAGACSKRRARAGLLVIHTREGHRPDLSDAPPRQGRARRPGAADRRRRARWAASWSAARPGTTSCPSSRRVDGEPVIDKPGKGAFYQTDLDLMLRNRGIETLLVCGVTTEVCVHTTVREANDRGYRCIVLARLLRLLLSRSSTRSACG